MEEGGFTRVLDRRKTVSDVVEGVGSENRARARV